MEKGHFGGYTGNARHSRKEEMIHDRELISDAKKQLHRADQDYKSDSPAQMNAKKGTNPIFNLSGKKGLQASNNPAAAYMTGSPVKHLMGGTSGGEVKHSHNETIPKPTEIKTSKKGTNTFYSDQVELMSDPTKTNIQTNNRAGDVVDQKTGLKDVDATNRAWAGIVDGMGATQSSTDQPTALDRQNQSQAKATNPSTPKKVVKKETKKEKVVASGPSSAQIKAQELEKRALTALSKRKKTPRTRDGEEAVRNFNANQKKKASEPKEMSRKQIRTAKQEDKLAGMSRKQVRANKLKRKADSAKAKTNKTIKSIDPTKAKSADTGAKQAKAKSQRAKTIRLQKRVARLKGKQEASKIK